ncbi:MAG: DUF1540 domain-containing protein [Clostridiales bacterium]|nr:DUF1540 domain-containing protein [Clostridiales bacterium]
MKNSSIKCDVCLCKHNVNGESCDLEKICVTNSSSQQTRCNSFCEKN